MAADHLRSFAPTEVRTAVLHEKPGARIVADYRGVEVRDGHWIVYPWAVFEDVGSFLTHMDPPTVDAEAVARRLLGDYGVHVDPLLASRLLDFCRQRLADRAG